MTGIGGPGGIGGPKGPGGPDAADEVDDLADAAPADAASGTAGVSAATTADPLSALAADVAAGRLTPQAALDQLIEQNVSPDLEPAERAELRELITDLVTNDPQLAGLFAGVR